MSNWQMNSDPERRRRAPGRVTGIGALLAALPFVGFGIYMIWQVLQTGGSRNWKFVAPFCLFVLAICSVPVVQAVRAFRKSRQPTPPDSPAPSSAAAGKPKVAGAVGLVLFGLPFAAFGVGALVAAFNKFREGTVRDALMLVGFGAVFSGAGFGLMAFALFGRRSAKRVSECQARHPDAPWRWRDDWASGQIRPNQRAAAVMLWVFTALWNAISWMVTFAFFTDRSQSHPRGVFLIILLFPAIGLMLLAAAIRTTLIWRRFGAAVLRLKTTPAILGGALEGAIELPVTLTKTAPVRAMLTCYRRVKRQDSDGSSIQDSLVWQAESVLKPGLPEIRPGHTGVPIFFRLPPDQPPATPGDSGEGSIIWRVEVEAKVPGPDLKLQFDVPVFGGDAPPVPVEDPTARFQLPVAEWRQAVHSRIQVTPTPQGGKEFYFPALRNRGASAFLVLFGLGWTVATVLLATSDAPVLFPIFFGLFNVLILALGFDLCFRRSRLVADRLSLTSTQQWLLLQRRREYRASEIREVFLKTGMTSGTKSYYDLKARLDSGREMTLASALPNRVEAEWLVGEMRRALGRE